MADGSVSRSAQSLRLPSFGIRGNLRHELSAPPGFKVNHLISERDWLTALGEITSNDDEGNEVTCAYCDVWRFEDDKLAELRAFVNRPTIPE